MISQCITQKMKMTDLLQWIGTGEVNEDITSIMIIILQLIITQKLKKGKSTVVVDFRRHNETLIFAFFCNVCI
jgi:hypothetical protein